MNDEKVDYFNSEQAMQVGIRQKLQSKKEGELLTEEDIEADFKHFGGV